MLQQTTKKCNGMTEVYTDRVNEFCRVAVWRQKAHAYFMVDVFEQGTDDNPECEQFRIVASSAIMVDARRFVSRHAATLRRMEEREEYLARGARGDDFMPDCPHDRRLHHWRQEGNVDGVAVYIFYTVCMDCGVVVKETVVPKERP
jgi:hypothetical protein